MRALKALSIAIVCSALWPLYFGLLSVLARMAPWPRSLGRPLAFGLFSCAEALFVANLASVLLRPDGWAETTLRLPRPLARQLRRTILVLLGAALAFLMPNSMLTDGMIAPAGRPLEVPILARLLLLAFELTAWILIYRLVRKRSSLFAVLSECPERFGWLCRNRRMLAVTLLAGSGLIISLDWLGYSFTANRLGSAVTQSALLAGLCWALYALAVGLIESHSWHWSREGTGTGHADPAENLAPARDLPRRLRQLARVAVPIAGALLGMWIWNVDLALFQSLGAIEIWSKGGITLGDVAKAALLFALTLGAWIHMSTFFAVAVFPRMRDDPGIRFAALTLSRYLVLGVGVVGGLSALHLGLQQIGMVLAALGVGLGFGLQEIVSNFVSGVILLIERPIRVGDIVTVSGMTGKVDRINIRATTIINADNQSIIVPNREFITSNLVNWTHKDRIIRVSISLNVAFGTCPDQVTDLLLAIAREDPDVLRNPVPSASVESFGEYGLNVALHVHVPDPSLGGRVKHRLCKDIQVRFRAAGIALPLPLRELHVRSIPSETLGTPAVAREITRLDAPSATPPAPRVASAPVAEESMTRCVDE